MTDPNAARSGWPPNCDGNWSHPQFDVAQIVNAEHLAQLERKERRRDRLKRIVFWLLWLALGGLLGWVAHAP